MPTKTRMSQALGFLFALFGFALGTVARLGVEWRVRSFTLMSRQPHAARWRRQSGARTSSRVPQSWQVAREQTLCSRTEATEYPSRSVPDIRSRLRSARFPVAEVGSAICTPAIRMG